MKVNFYISCENAAETKACLDFIADMEAKRGRPADTDEPVVVKGLRTTPDGGLVVPRLNVSPGEPSISKIGEQAKLEVLNAVANGHAVPARLSEHAKLLWKRGEVKFDREGYYV